MKSALWARALVVAAVFVMATASFAAAAAPRLRAPLAGPAISGLVPGGTGNWETSADRTKLSVQVEDVNLPNGTVLSVEACGASVGTIRLVARGGDLNLDSRNGQVVPSCAAGNSVSVKSGASTVLSGTFAAK